MLKNTLLATAMLVAVAGAARAEPRPAAPPLFTLAATGPVQTPAEQPAPAGTTVLGYDVQTVATVTIGAMFGAAIGTEVVVITLGVYGYPASTLWLAGSTAFVTGALGGGALADWILQSSRAPHQSPFERQNGNGPQVNLRR